MKIRFKLLPIILCVSLFSCEKIRVHETDGPNHGKQTGKSADPYNPEAPGPSQGSGQGSGNQPFIVKAIYGKGCSDKTKPAYPNGSDVTPLFQKICSDNEEQCSFTFPSDVPDVCSGQLKELEITFQCGNVQKTATLMPPYLFDKDHKFLLSCDKQNYILSKFYYGGGCATNPTPGGDVNTGCLDLTEKYAPNCGSFPCNFANKIIPMDKSLISETKKNLYIEYQCPGQSAPEIISTQGPATLNLSCPKSQSPLKTVIYGNGCTKSKQLGYKSGVNFTSLYQPFCSQLPCTIDAQSVPALPDICANYAKKLEFHFFCASQEKVLHYNLGDTVHIGCDIQEIGGNGPTTSPNSTNTPPLSKEEQEKIEDAASNGIGGGIGDEGFGGTDDSNGFFNDDDKMNFNQE